MDAELRKLIKRHGFEQSMCRADEVYDNAFAERSFSRYKTELLEDDAFADLEQEVRNLRLYRRILQSDPPALGLGIFEPGEL